MENLTAMSSYILSKIGISVFPEALIKVFEIDIARSLQHRARVEDCSGNTKKIVESKMTQEALRGSLVCFVEGLFSSAAAKQRGSCES